MSFYRPTFLKRLSLLEFEDMIKKMASFSHSYDKFTRHWHDGQSVRQWPGRPGFNPRLSHTKNLKKLWNTPSLPLLMCGNNK